MSSRSGLWIALVTATLIAIAIYWISHPPTPPSDPLDRLETTTRMHDSEAKIGGSESASPGLMPAPGSLPGGVERPTSARSSDALKEARTPIRLYRDARVQPVYDLATNQVKGVRILDVQPDSFWAEMDVRSHDVILECNGTLIDSPASTVALMKAMSQGQALSLRLRGADGEERFAEYRAAD
jgi:S1-C subfamily serine protease